MEIINTQAICISFIVEWHDDLFIVLHRGNVKRHNLFFTFELKIKEVSCLVQPTIFSIRNQLLNKFTNDWHSKFQVVEVMDDNMTQLQRQVARVEIKALSPMCHTWNSKNHPVP